ncbi:MAG: hypothetical protein U9Q15_00030, partial [Patescibacteria group bacterium]|nr:hypothetical protein [Patescibacteria group bacterium]
MKKGKEMKKLLITLFLGLILVVITGCSTKELNTNYECDRGENCKMDSFPIQAVTHKVQYSQTIHNGMTNAALLRDLRVQYPGKTDEQLSDILVEKSQVIKSQDDFKKVFAPGGSLLDDIGLAKAAGFQSRQQIAYQTLLDIRSKATDIAQFDADLKTAIGVYLKNTLGVLDDAKRKHIQTTYWRALWKTYSQLTTKERDIPGIMQLVQTKAMDIYSQSQFVDSVTGMKISYFPTYGGKVLTDENVVFQGSLNMDVVLQLLAGDYQNKIDRKLKALAQTNAERQVVTKKMLGGAVLGWGEEDNTGNIPEGYSLNIATGASYAVYQKPDGRFSFHLLTAAGVSAAEGGEYRGVITPGMMASYALDDEKDSSISFGIAGLYGDTWYPGLSLGYTSGAMSDTSHTVSLSYMAIADPLAAVTYNQGFNTVIRATDADHRASLAFAQRMAKWYAFNGFVGSQYTEDSLYKMDLMNRISQKKKNTVREDMWSGWSVGLSSTTVLAGGAYLIVDDEVDMHYPVPEELVEDLDEYPAWQSFLPAPQRNLSPSQAKAVLNTVLSDKQSTSVSYYFMDNTEDGLELEKIGDRSIDQESVIGRNDSSVLSVEDQLLAAQEKGYNSYRIFHVVPYAMYEGIQEFVYVVAYKAHKPMITQSVIDWSARLQIDRETTSVGLGLMIAPIKKETVKVIVVKEEGEPDTCEGEGCSSDDIPEVPDADPTEPVDP